MNNDTPAPTSANQDLTKDTDARSRRCAMAFAATSRPWPEEGQAFDALLTEGGL